MNNTDLHIIRKQLIDLELYTQQGALAMQQRVSQLFQEKVVKALDQAFADLNLGEQVLKIPYLEIDLGDIAPERLDKEFVEQCVQNIVKEVQQKAAALGHHVSDHTFSGASAFQLFQHFLKTGQLPWYATNVSLKSLEASFKLMLQKQKEKVLYAMLNLFDVYPDALERFILQISDEVIFYFIKIGWSQPPSIIKALQLSLETFIDRKFSQKEKGIFLKVVLQQLFKKGEIPSVNKASFEHIEFELKRKLEPIEKANIKKIVQQQLFVDENLDLENIIETALKTKAYSKSQNDLKDEELAFETNIKDETLASVNDEQPIKEELLEDAKKGWIVENAGLVICAYFFNPLFKGFEFVADKKFIDKSLQHRAVHLSQYLVSGNEQVEEFLLPLNKLLCGVPLQEPIDRMISLTEEEKLESENLLAHLIKHWSFLGNTSVEGLRNTFLIRKGKLSYDSNFSNWLLQVEKQGYDICMEHLPWSISIIKLPWMLEPLHVEWV